MTDLSKVKNFKEKDWYNLFVSILLDSHNEELENFYNSVRNAIDDAFAITSVKKRYEEKYNHIGSLCCHVAAAFSGFRPESGSDSRS